MEKEGLLKTKAQMLEVVNLGRKIVSCMNESILKQGQPIIILEHYEWLREVLSLFAKQSNLFESILVLLENNMEQEAYVLARSQFNNTLWINYLCDGEDISRLKEYYYEQHISQYLNLYNMKKYIKENKDMLDKHNLNSIDLGEIKEKMGEIKNVLKKEGYNTEHLQNKKISDLAKVDPILHGTYLSFYHDASRFEHSDIRTVKKYREQIVDDYDCDTAFIFEINKSDLDFWKRVSNLSVSSCFYSVNALYKRLLNRDKHLFDFEMFSINELGLLIKNIDVCKNLIDEIEI